MWTSVLQGILVKTPRTTRWSASKEVREPFPHPSSTFCGYPKDSHKEKRYRLEKRWKRVREVKAKCLVAGGEKRVFPSHGCVVADRQNPGTC